MIRVAALVLNAPYFKISLLPKTVYIAHDITADINIKLPIVYFELKSIPLSKTTSKIPISATPIPKLFFNVSFSRKKMDDNIRTIVGVVAYNKDAFAGVVNFNEYIKTNWLK
jgi:hypothetical protein